MILSDLLPDILGRLEENVESGPIFWNKSGEVYQQMVDGMFEAALVTGVFQAFQVLVNLPANTTYFDLQGASAVVSKGMLAPIRMRAAYAIRKVTLKGLDEMSPGWQQESASTQIKAWGPLGISKFFIYPQLSVESDVTMDFIQCPLNQARPYTGAETIPMQIEFSDLLPQYGAAVCRIKQGGLEAEESADVYKQYLSRIKALSLFQGRLDNLIFSGPYGGRGEVNPRTSV